MILRAFALLIGIPLTLLGLLAVVTAVGMVGNPGPQGGPPPIAAQVIGVIIMAGVAATGQRFVGWACVGVQNRTMPIRLHRHTSLATPELATETSPRI